MTLSETPDAPGPLQSTTLKGLLMLDLNPGPSNSHEASSYRKSFFHIFLYRNYAKIAFLLILLGFVSRLISYLFNRSLWLDEALLASNIIEKPLFDLFGPLDYDQICPYGFLILESLAVQFAGDSEYVLRFFSFFFGSISLFMSFRLANKFLSPLATILFVFLFSFSTTLIYYSSEAKQYSLDLAVSISLLLMLTKLIRNEDTSLSYFFLLGASGSIAIWFSHPSVFILAGCGTTLLLFSLYKRDLTLFRAYLLLSFSWLLSFFLFFRLSLHSATNNQNQLKYFSRHFAPLNIFDPNNVKWYIGKLFGFFDYVLGIPFSGLAFMCLLFGMIFILSESKKLFFMLFFPILFAVIACLLQKYPFVDRTLLFILPSVLMFFSVGSAKISYIFSKISIFLCILFLLILLSFPFFRFIDTTFKPRNREDIKVVLEYIYKHNQTGDKIYVYDKSIPAFKYYFKKYSIDENAVILGDNPDKEGLDFSNDISKIRKNKRVWLVFSHVLRNKYYDHEKLLLESIDKFGKRMHTKRANGSSTYLYQLDAFF